ncbi:hypothetical protein KIW84_041789 [Lathyrus oleraceus]|uniref:Uncharacterized protein n=1 Tax=Pisum sativum TaxID=3888 RepID=A0A9D5ALV6_PEA|nr:hypothetical protein KIW84_041789 [Pisum sativum]
MKFHPTGMVEAAKLSNDAVSGHGTDTDSEIQEKVSKPSSMPVKIHQLSTSEFGKEKQCVIIGTTESRQELRPNKIDPPSHTAESNMVTVPTAKGGMRRKHHRAWTLAEVTKLIEGVSCCGPGRWSEIKRRSFSSYSHRTSVDLKDKWRNLLKASFAHTPADEGMNSRKHGTAPIPEHILVRLVCMEIDWGTCSVVNIIETVAGAPGAETSYEAHRSDVPYSRYDCDVELNSNHRDLPAVDKHIDVSEEEGWFTIPCRELPENWNHEPDIQSLRSLDRSFFFPAEQVHILACLSACKQDTQITTPFEVAAMTIANESNTYEIVTELCEYAANVDIPIARESIRAVGKIALQQYDVNAIVDRLLQFLEMKRTMLHLKLCNIVQEPKAKAALIWMLGEYSKEMHDAPLPP